MRARGSGPSTRLERSLAATAAAVLVASLGACTDVEDQLSVMFYDEAPATAVLPGEDAAQTALTLSAALVESADAAVVATEETAGALADVSAETGLPLLIGTDQAVAEEIERLGADAVVTAAGTDLSGLGDDLEAIEIDPGSDDEAGAVPEVSADEEPTTASMLLDPEQGGLAQTVARTHAEAAGGTVADVPGGDPRATGETVAAAREAGGQDPSTGVLAVGESFGGTEQFTRNLATAVTAPELPGGGQQAFPHRRMIAAYGSPGTPSLGILGEQPLDETIERVQGLAADYEDLSEVPVIPAMEIITTVAAVEPGPDGDHSQELDPQLIREWVDAAGEAGIYVVLDLQPGTTDFLTQAQLYEDVLTEPHVGLALDPEWRLEPGQKHMEQIGSVPAEEVNETARWLAELTTENNLPQKVFILHQFNQGMISDRQDVDASHPELAMVLHADGNGTPEDKLGTWNALQQDLPGGIRMAWKNFYDEDTPTFTPEQTFDLESRPWFVSYQ